MRRYPTRLAIVLAVLLAIAACSPVEDPDTAAEGEPDADEAAGEGPDTDDADTDDAETDDADTDDAEPDGDEEVPVEEGASAGESDLYGPPPEDPQEGGTVTVGALNEPPSLDPFHEGADARSEYSVLMYQGLMYESSHGVPVPLLAEDVEISDDELTYTFELREGVEFHDGSPMTSADVQYSYDYIRDPDNGSPGAQDFAAIDTIEAPDEHTVVMELSEPNSALLMTLTNKFGAVVPEDYFDSETAEQDFNTASVGTGPYQLEDFSPNESISLSRHEGYWGDGPYIDELVFEFIPDASAMVVALENARIDLGELPQITDIEQLEGTPGLEVATFPSLNQKAIDLVANVEPLDEEPVRQAIAAALDKEEVAQAAAPELHQEIGMIVGGMQETWGLPLDEVPYQGQDLETAEELLAEAGYEDGFEIDLRTIQDFDWMDAAAVVITQQLAEVGIDVSTETVDLGTWIDAWNNQAAGFTLNDWGTQPDPSLLYFRHFSQEPQGADFRLWDHDEASQLLADGIATSDQEERVEIYHEFQSVMAESAPTIPLYSPQAAIATHDRLANYVHHPSGWYFGLATAYVDE
ncbi:ABC transporter substrate-binding protein [Egibacter rhizosphaerae]|uniref:ABC transporter substrate-binding protein n=1 Tax=Egibacter rhizosphaerae TaxID=1670831 RepID=A0A411YI41_9ACTN|nr:ABC transporter substrate-binding protein [Egibacter rhizosphaerae]QBI20799.1 ABC transporter substrate-binding protein [Egibacter rhizosphaerae]